MNREVEARHSVWIRLFHWGNAVSILFLILTGFQIHTPWSVKIFGNLEAARALHFLMAYVLVIGVVGRFYYAVVKKDGHNVVFNPVKDTALLPGFLKYELFLTDSHPEYGKYNPGQKMMYTGWFVMAILMIITGFILYKPNQFIGLSNALGGMVAIRLVHYIINWLFVLSIVVHVYLDFSESPEVLKSMFTEKVEHVSHSRQKTAVPKGDHA